MDPLKRVLVGRSGLEVTALGFGGGTLGDPYETTEDDQADATLGLAYDAGVRYFDTAPWYGNTKSEHRVGRFLRRQPPGFFTLSTKVGRLSLRPDDPAAFADAPRAARRRGSPSGTSCASSRARARA